MTDRQFKWFCHRTDASGCWSPVQIRADMAEAEARRYGCTHEGVVLQRAVFRTFGPWVARSEDVTP